MIRALRVLLSVWVLLAPATSNARLMVVAPNIDEQSGESIANNFRMRRILESILNRTGADYAVIPDADIRTEFFRSGVQVWNYGKPGAYTEEFDAVLFFGALLGGTHYASSAGDAPNFRPDSLLKGGSTKAPTVPHLWVATNINGLINSNDNMFVDGSSAGRCTTGVSASGQTPFGGTGRGAYLSSDRSIRAILPTYVEFSLLNATPPAGGVRPVVSAAHVGYSTHTTPNGRRMGWNGPWNSLQPDSLNQFVTNDSVFIWDRLMAHIAGASPVAFAWAGGVGFADDSMTSANSLPRTESEGDYFMMLAALAHLDSISGGAVWGDQLTPIKVALTVDGAFSYNSRMHPRGILKSDSSTFDSSMDSLASLGIPVTFGVAYDSVASYPEWKRWLAKLGNKARFSPQSWAGVQDSTAVSNGNASSCSPIDVWGRNRKRAFLGDTSSACSATDSTLYKLLRGARARVDSIWPGQLSNFAMPPMDDYTPRNLNSVESRGNIDSVLLAVRLAGFRGMRINGHDRDCDAQYLRSNPRGWHGAQGWYKDSRREPFPLLAYPGHSLGGAVLQSISMGDSVAPADSVVASWGKLYEEVARAWIGATQLADRSTDLWTSHMLITELRVPHGEYLNEKDFVRDKHHKGYIIRIDCNDLSGDPTRPARVGWWTVKTLASQFKMINRLAGRTVIEFAYPEDIEP